MTESWKKSWLTPRKRNSTVVLLLLYCTEAFVVIVLMLKWRCLWQCLKVTPFLLTQKTPSKKLKDGLFGLVWFLNSDFSMWWVTICGVQLVFGVEAAGVHLVVFHCWHWQFVKVIFEKEMIVRCEEFLFRRLYWLCENWIICIWKICRDLTGWNLPKMDKSVVISFFEVISSTLIVSFCNKQVLNKLTSFSLEVFFQILSFPALVRVASWWITHWNISWNVNQFFFITIEKVTNCYLKLSNVDLHLIAVVLYGA